jgi:hypothetical protein
MGLVRHVDFVSHAVSDSFNVIVKVDLCLDETKHLELEFIHVICQGFWDVVLGVQAADVKKAHRL